MEEVLNIRELTSNATEVNIQFLAFFKSLQEYENWPTSVIDEIITYSRPNLFEVSLALMKLAKDQEVKEEDSTIGIYLYLNTDDMVMEFFEYAPLSDEDKREVDKRQATLLNTNLGQYTINWHYLKD